MGKFLAFLIVLALAGYGAWYVFVREAEPVNNTTSAVEEELQKSDNSTPETKSMLPSGEAPRSIIGRAYNHSATTATEANDRNNAAIEAQINSM